MLLSRPGACGLKLSGSHPHPVCLAVGRPARSRADQQQQHPATVNARPASSCRAHRLVARFKNGGDAQTAEKQSEADTAGGPSDDATLVPVTFELSKHCPFGQALAILGDASALGEWDVTRALRLEWSEGDVWVGRAEVPLDTPVAFKYIQVDDGGGLVCWGSDIAGGTNLSLLVSPSDEALSLVLEPAEAADTSHTPSLVVHLDSADILPESAAAAAGENGLLAAAGEDGQPTAASSATDVGSSWESGSDPAEADEALLATDASVVAADEQQAAAEEEEAEDDEQPQAGLSDEPSAEWGTDSDDEPAAAAAGAQAAQQLLEEQAEPTELEAAGEEREDAGSASGSVGQLQLQDGATATGSEASQGEQQQEQEEEGGGVGTAAPGQAEEGSVGQADEAAAAAVVAAGGPGEEATAESMQDQGLRSDTQGLAGDAAGAGAGAGGRAGSRPLLDPLADGGVAAGYGDAASVGASVAAGLMEAGDGETAAGPPAPTLDTGTPPPSWASSSSTSSVSSHMITSIDQEGGSEADDDSSSHDPIGSNSVVDSPPREMDKGQLMAATAQESARLASSTAADSADGTAATAATDSSRGALEGVPSTTPADSSTPADAVLGRAVASVVVPGAAGCQPPPADSKLVAASPSIASVDADAPLAGGSDKKAITEIEGGSSGVEPVDKYGDSGLGALAALAAAAAASYDGGHDHEPPTDREGGAAAAEERQLQLVRAEDEEEQEAAGRSGGGASVDGERTGTWTGEAAAAAAATDSGSSGGKEGTQRATEEAPAAGDSVQQPKKPRNWLQRLFGGGDDSKDDRA